MIPVDDDLLRQNGHRRHHSSTLLLPALQHKAQTGPAVAGGRPEGDGWPLYGALEPSDQPKKRSNCQHTDASRPYHEHLPRVLVRSGFRLEKKHRNAFKCAARSGNCLTLILSRQRPYHGCDIGRARQSLEQQ
ncbi:hypothetical protein GQ607_015871 [Colletotrichum asianum]|uniref:Uncharacterized protein n=1 Tax=Colletotrichum asianum TaxID=702518 RepID=A0A8H3W0H4_9PEZI|nr:hypothetical protein GQ607_015871 [Colletotrichum asianum]